MHKLFVSPGDICENTITVTGEDVEHLHALRMREGESIFVSDGEKTVYEAELTQMRKNSAVFEIKSQRPFENEPLTDITVFIALLKGGACEDVIKQSVELGANRIIVFSSSNCIAKEREKDAKYLKTARQAAMQCGRDAVPEVLTGFSFEEMLEELKKAEISLFFHEKATDHFYDVLEKNSLPRSAAFAVGPEGGFTDFEAESAEKSGIKVVSMGKRILRAATAPLCALAVITSLYDRRR
ncbi:MAG: 16S rRNA (uracil(1498)-N(3))-methyltransferase [Clostridia bacterium]|nr:16S rRNA (uracil(1498)-N(3))-methyltransferase [Clostridia bacterium]